MAGDVQQQRSWMCLEGEPDHYFAITIAINNLMDGKYLVTGEEKEWRRKRGRIFRDGKYLVSGRKEGKGGRQGA